MVGETNHVSHQPQRPKRAVWQISWMPARKKIATVRVAKPGGLSPTVSFLTV